MFVRLCDQLRRAPCGGAVMAAARHQHAVVQQETAQQRRFTAPPATPEYLAKVNAMAGRQEFSYVKVAPDG